MLEIKKDLEITKINLPQTLEVVIEKDFQRAYYELLNAIDTLNEIKTQVDTKVKELLTGRFNDTKEKQVSGTKVAFTFIEPTIRETIDSKKLKEELPDVYKKYSKISLVKESMRVKVIEKK